MFKLNQLLKLNFYTVKHKQNQKGQMKWISRPLLKSTVCKHLRKTSIYFGWGGEDGRGRG